MFKKLSALFLSLLLLIPGALQAAAIQTPEEAMLESTTMTLDFSLHGKLKTLLEPFIQMELAKSQDDVANAMVLQKVLNGDRISIGFSFDDLEEPKFVFSLPITDEEFVTFTKDFEKTSYGGTDIYSEDSSSFAAKISNFLFLSPLSDAMLKEAIDLGSGASTNSLAKNEAYQKTASSLLSPRLLGATINVQALGSFFGKVLEADAEDGDDENDPGQEKGKKVVEFLTDILQLFEYEGLSLAEVPEGYKFNIKIVGNPEALQAEGMSLNPSGNFTPSLYRKFPAATPLLYTESFDTKTAYEQSKLLTDKFKQFLALGNEVDLFATIKEETGFDLEALYRLFEKESAFALQYDAKSPLPSFTFMGDVTSTKAAAQTFLSDSVKLIKKWLKEADVPAEAYSITKEGDLTKITFNLEKLDENYDGPPFPPVVFTLGITADDMFIISSYPGVEKSGARTGFTLPFEPKAGTGIFYMSPRNGWLWLEKFMAWTEEISNGKDGPPLDFYQGYYSFLPYIYGWKDLIIETEGTESESLLTGTVVIDDAKHETFDEFLLDLKENDSDEDGLTDYEEKYVYHTPVSSADSDDDGTSDLDELKKGADPDGEGRLFKDVGEDAYYTDETAFLHQRGAIAGYADGTFQPGRLVNRAEFTAMVMKAFQEDTSSFLGVDASFGNLGGQPSSLFVDVAPNAWYYDPVIEANRAGFVSGSIDAKTGRRFFRPGDEINRAEAMVILKKASQGLSRSKTPVQCEEIFDDVSRSDWFCEAVGTGFTEGVTKGKSAKAFKPYDKLTRAEAAVMIQRSLERDVEVQDSTESFGELSAPISNSLAPLLLQGF